MKNINENDLEKLNEQFYSLQTQIEAKRNMLLEKQNIIKKMNKENELLNSVKNDYSKYYKYIIEQKQQQLKALNALTKYVDDLSSSGELSQQNIEDAKYEKEKIINEIKTIRNNLDNLIKFTEK